MTKYRKYDKRTKLAVVMAADMVGVVQAEKQSGIPESTIRYWMDQPEFAEIRAKTREELVEEIKVVAHLAWQRTGEALRDGTMEPRDVLFAAEKATNLQLLMAGEATSRTESRSLSDVLDDHERSVLAAVVARELADREAAGSDTGDGVDAGAAPVST